MAVAATAVAATPPLTECLFKLFGCFVATWYSRDKVGEIRICQLALLDFICIALCWQGDTSTSTLYVRFQFLRWQILFHTHIGVKYKSLYCSQFAQTICSRLCMQICVYCLAENSKPVWAIFDLCHSQLAEIFPEIFPQIFVGISCPRNS